MGVFYSKTDIRDSIFGIWAHSNDLGKFDLVRAEATEATPLRAWKPLRG
ncbi:MAG: hypothetical protein HN736_09545 [Anaerolineae bacterium]|nr:hypothetical protein [Anaerolineae bacterium]MBT3714371.1 hypothetical protein [Anaerolineae bacterium]MBT4309527.1 hypothetical protein [Anaerolineae bacterium]MBT4458398.1 hypothetical protein [Anaerolineae bacterium]MBT4841233.1 hypothetical protein [Anaerolineae bacterium]